MHRRLLAAFGCTVGGVFAVRSSMAAQQPWSSSKDANTILKEPAWPETFPLSPEHFRRIDETSDGDFYAEPRMVHHIDEHAIATLKRLYGKMLPQGGVVVDLMSSWTSHLSDGKGANKADGHFAKLIAIGMNELELQANPAAHEYHVADLNVDPSLAMLKDSSVDAVFCSVSVDYLTQPLEVFAEIKRVLKPGGLAVFTWSNRMFPQKAIHAWRAASEPERLWICGSYFHYTGGFSPPTGQDVSPYPGRSDPVYFVHARKEATAAKAEL